MLSYIALYLLIFFIMESFMSLQRVLCKPSMTVQMVVLLDNIDILQLSIFWSTAVYFKSYFYLCCLEHDALNTCCQ